MSQVCLEIGDLETLVAFIEDAKRTGLMKDVSLDNVKDCFRKKSFPIRIPVDMNAFLEVAGNPIIRKAFGKKIEKKTVDILNQALRPG